MDRDFLRLWAGLFKENATRPPRPLRRRGAIHSVFTMDTLTRFETGHIRRRTFGIGRNSSTPAFPVSVRCMAIVGLVSAILRESVRGDVQVDFLLPT